MMETNTEEHPELMKAQKIEKNDDDLKNLMYTSIFGKIVKLTLDIIVAVQDTILEQLLMMKQMMMGKEAENLKEVRDKILELRGIGIKKVISFFK